MRRACTALVFAPVVLVCTSGAAAAAPSPGPSAGSHAGTAGGRAGAGTAAQAVCTVRNPAAIELSGLASTATGYVTMNDSNVQDTAFKVFVLDNACRVVKSWNYPGPPNRPLDPEDLAVDRAGVVWVADTGDDITNPRRPRIALWRFQNGVAKAPPYRFTYPDGPHDGEALLLSGDGSPIFVTKRAAGPAGIYVPTRPPDPSGNPVPLRKAGEFQPQRTGTPNPLGLLGLGENAVTGGSVSPDGTHAVLRTYADAYEWDVTGGDVVKAITTGRPRLLPLPNEPMGEAIAYTRDGAAFVTIADQEGPVKLLKYARPVPPEPSGAGTSSSSKGTALLSSITPSQITNLVIGIGVLGALMLIGGIVGIRITRRRRAQAADHRAGSGRSRGGGHGVDGYDGYAGYADRGHDDYDDYGGYEPSESTGSRSRRSSTYGPAGSGRARPGSPGSPGSASSTGRVYPAGASGYSSRGSTYGSPRGGDGYGTPDASRSADASRSTGGVYGSSSGRRSASRRSRAGHDDDEYGSGSGYGSGRHGGSSAARGSAGVYRASGSGGDDDYSGGWDYPEDDGPRPSRHSRH